MTFLQFYLLRETVWAIGQPHYSKEQKRPRKPFLEPHYRRPLEKIDYDELYRQYIFKDDEKAYRKLFENLKTIITRQLYDHFYDEKYIQIQDVEDAVQYALSRIVRGKSNTYDPQKGNLPGYIYIVARNMLWNRINKAKGPKNLPKTINTIVSQNPSYAVHPSELPEDPAQYVRKLIDSLPDTKRWERPKQILELIAKGHKKKDIIQMLGIEKSTLYKNVGRAAEYLKTQAV